MYGLDIQYKSTKLRKLCLVSKEADRKLGPRSGPKLRTRLAEIDAASNVSELIVGRPHPLTGNKTGEFSLDLSGGDRLIFVSEKDPPPMKEDGGIDWLDVESVIVIFIGDPHE